MAIPLVTFAVGGIGQYVNAPRRAATTTTLANTTTATAADAQRVAGEAEGDAEEGVEGRGGEGGEGGGGEEGLFSVTGNAVVVHETTPRALAAGTNKHTLLYILHALNV